MRQRSIRNPPEIFIPDHKKFVLLTKYVSRVENIQDKDTEEFIATEMSEKKVTKILFWQDNFNNLIINFDDPPEVQNYIQAHFDQLWDQAKMILE